MKAVEPANHPVHVGPYIAVFGALMVLTVVTVAVSYLDLSVASGVLLAVAIASVKAALVAMFFMHLKGERAMVYWPLSLTMFLFVGLLVSLIWSEADHLFGTQFTHAFDSPAGAAATEPGAAGGGEAR